MDYTKKVPYEIVLVDNASTECNPSAFIEKFPGLILVKSEVNGGFAKGNNLGISYANGDFILLLNSDTLLREDSISASVHFCNVQQKAGIVGCRMTYVDQTVQYTARRFRSITWELLDFFRFIIYLFPYKKRARMMLGKYFRHDENIECDWVNGAFFLFPTSILSAFPDNKLDERFFMYGEDQLWCYQVKKHGFRVLFFSETTIVHINSGSTDINKQLSLKKIMMKNELAIMQERKGKSLYYQIFAALFITKEMIRNTIKVFYFKRTGKIIR